MNLMIGIMNNNSKYLSYFYTIKIMYYFFISILFIIQYSFNYNNDQPHFLFGNITSIQHISEDKFWITTSTGDNHLHMIDAANHEIIVKNVRNGDGPFEARGLSAITKCNDNPQFLYAAISNNGKVILLNHELQPEHEFVTPERMPVSIDCEKDEISISSEVLVTTSSFVEGENISVVSVYSISNSKLLYDVNVPLSSITLGDKFDLNKLNYIGLYPISTKFRDGYLLAFRGASQIYYIFNNEVIKVDIPSFITDLGYYVAYRPEFGHGQGLSPVNFQIHHLSEGIVSLPFQLEINQSIIYGDVLVTPSNDVGGIADVSYRLFETVIIETGYIPYAGDNFLILRPGDMNFSNYINIYPLVIQ